MADQMQVDGGNSATQGTESGQKSEEGPLRDRDLSSVSEIQTRSNSRISGRSSLAESRAASMDKSANRDSLARLGEQIKVPPLVSLKNKQVRAPKIAPRVVPKGTPRVVSKGTPKGYS
ncbi:MAG: hypothetical protein LBF49_02105 [Puniceicoccales bacterium]|jgi:hypothetical protein|nr:hypothetical protein [Puniceicoccales bacterium]